MKKFSYLFIVLAIFLSDIMCSVVAYNYCNLIWSTQYAGYSVPASTAFFYAIPFVIGILVCAILAIVFHKKEDCCSH